MDNKRGLLARLVADMSRYDNFSLHGLLEAASQRMKAELAEQLVPHPGEKGAAREEICRQFLRSYLPQRFDVSTGFAFDAHGTVSKQLDIVISDAFACPRFAVAGDIRFFPCESVVAVGQVKSSLTSRRALREALANLESVKALDRSANGHAYDKIRDEAIDHRTNHLHQIFTFLMITDKALKKETVFGELEDYLGTREPHLWPNMIVAIDKYLVTYCCADGICPNTMHALGIAIKTPSEIPDLLMRFYLVLGKVIEATRVSGIPHWSYSNSLMPWNADVFFPAIESPLLADDRMMLLSEALRMLREEQEDTLE